MPKATTITFRGQTYALKLGADIAQMPADQESLAASFWVMKNTYPKGYRVAQPTRFPAIHIRSYNVTSTPNAAR